MIAAEEYLPSQNIIDRESAIKAIREAVSDALNDAAEVPGLDERQIRLIMIIKDEL